jgi:single-stranded-DNA-specific exonuclease
MHAALAQCAHTLEGFGGHAMAAGVKVREDRLEAFAQAFAEVVAAMRGDDDDFRPLLEIDCVCALPELGIPSVRAVEELRPFGRGNPRPALLVEGARVTRSRIFGKTGTHLELTLEQGNRFQQVQWWDGARFAGEFKPGVQVDAVVEVKLGKRHIAEVEATLLDIQRHSAAPSAAPRMKESVP